MEDAIQLTGEITDFLLKKGIETLIDTSVVEKLDKYQELSCSLDEMDADMIIAVGGDGTILRTQSFISHKKIPLFGINMGTVGFLTEIDPENAFKAIEEVL